MHSALACVHKCFTQMGHLKSAKTNVCETASNTRLKHLLAVEKNICAQAIIIESLHHRI